MTLTPITALVVSRQRIARDGMCGYLRESGIDAHGFAPTELPDEVDSVRVVLVDRDVVDENLLDGLRQFCDKFVVFGLEVCEAEIRPLIGLGVHGYLDAEADIDQWISVINDVLNDRLDTRVGVIINRLLHSQPRKTPEHTESLSSPPIATQTHRFDLTARQREILRLIEAEGLNNKEIAQRLHLEVNTVKNHVHEILRKLRVDSRNKAVAKVKSLELVPSHRAS